MKKVAVIGHYAFGFEYLDGQTIKTKIVSNELSKYYGDDNVLKIDTHGGKKTFFKAPFQVIRALKIAKNIIILPAHNGLRVYAPLLSFFRRFFENRKLHYVVIGGWLPEFLRNKKWLSKKLKKFDGIYVETNTMKKALEEQGFSNVVVMPNCKELIPLAESALVYAAGEPYKLCTFSRVMKEKGIEDAIDAVKSVNEHFGRTVYELDIYGQVDQNQTEWFEKLCQDFPSYVRYSGLVPFDKSVDVLKNYFALLFPTYYEGEGFAGTLIDALAAGAPVVASDWRYNAEIVIEGETGLLYPTKNNEMFIQKLIWIYENSEQCNNMKTNCIQKAYQYQPKTVIQVLCQRLA